MTTLVRRLGCYAWFLLAGLLWLQLAGCGQPLASRWYKGNTHTHTWWSDGDSPPEIVVKWYKDHGYQFLVLSDHNCLSEGEKWVVADKKRSEGAKAYEALMGPGQVTKRQNAEGQTEYRCTPLDKLKTRFEQPERFLLMPGEEISGSSEGKPVHMNGLNLKTVIPAQKEATILDALQNNVNAVFAQQAQTGQPMLVHVNHPNFGWGLRAEHLVMLQGPVLFEVGNGHSGVNNRGDDTYMSVERMWDVALTKRLAEYGLPILYGMGTDDAHAFSNPGGSGPGRAYVMVRATRLSSASLVEAMCRGDFYASTGVTLKDCRFANGRLDIEIEPQSGVRYKTQFIGTLAGYDGAVKYLPSDPKRGPASAYSEDIGRVLAECDGTAASYKLTGREIYVRAKIISSAPHAVPVVAGEYQVAWTQPVRAGEQ